MPASSTRTHRLLVVEDDAEMRRLLVKALGAKEREVVDAADGEEAIRLLDAGEPFDLVVSDIRMPNCDGNDVLREIVQRHPGVKVVLITAFGDFEEYMESMERGAFEYLTKPLKLVDLARAVNRALGSG